MLVELQPQGLRQGALNFGAGRGPLVGSPGISDKPMGRHWQAPLCDRVRLMVALDDLNTRYGRGKLRFAAAGLAID